MSADDFVAHIARAGGDTDAAEWVRRHLLEWTVAPGFTPHPNDDLHHLFGIDEEERDEDLVLALFEQLGLPAPTTELVARFGPVDTPLRVARLVRFARNGWNTHDPHHAD